MSYVEKHLIDGEKVVYETRLHWTVLVAPFLLGLLFAVPGIALLAFSASRSGDKGAAGEFMMAVGAALLVGAVVCAGRGIVSRSATEMAVTNKRIVVKVGVAARRTIELLLSRVESIDVEESVMGRMLGYGTVVVHGTGGTPESFDRIARPLEFRTQVQQQIEKSQSRQN